MGEGVMSWPHVRDRLTAFDLLEAGACFDGVRDAVASHGILAAPTSRCLKVAGGDAKHVIDAAFLDGSGSGSGYGYGDGSGSGDGYGSGYGSGSGSGSGCGSGCCYGSGCGAGPGHGDGCRTGRRVGSGPG